MKDVGKEVVGKELTTPNQPQPQMLQMMQMMASMMNGFQKMGSAHGELPLSFPRNGAMPKEHSNIRRLPTLDMSDNRHGSGPLAIHSFPLAPTLASSKASLLPLPPPPPPQALPAQPSEQRLDLQISESTSQLAEPHAESSEVHTSLLAPPPSGSLSMLAMLNEREIEKKSQNNTMSWSSSWSSSSS